MSRLEPTNVSVAELLGLTDATVSRFRSGARTPRIATQKLIADKLGWSLADQAQAHADGTWAQGFEAAITAAPCGT